MKIDNFFTELIDVLLQAGFAARDQKILFTGTAATKLDQLKYFLYLMYRSGELDSKKYIEISMLLSEIGKMLGGWRKQLLKTEGASRS